MSIFSKDIKTLDDLFVHMLRDIYYAEKQIVKSLPDLIEKATDADLKAGLSNHLEESKGHVERLEEVGNSSATSPSPTFSTRPSSPPPRPSSITRSPGTAP
jgi:ferritin-like metal-binding protein YciE